MSEGTSEGTSEGPTGSTSTSEDTGSTGGGSGNLLPERFCHDTCEYLLLCESPLAQDLSSCIEECVNAPFSEKPGCFEAAAAWWSCFPETTCEGVKIVPTGGCDPYYANYFSVCGDCDAAIAHEGADACSATLDCPDVAPFSLLCSGGSCTCELMGFESYVECPARGICAADDAEIFAFAEDCCIVNF